MMAATRGGVRVRGAAAGRRQKRRSCSIAGLHEREGLDAESRTRARRRAAEPVEGWNGGGGGICRH